jgi:formiminoglutamase
MPPPDMRVWNGRTDEADGPRALRWHQMVKPLTPDWEPGIAIVGFACDEGVRRNQGRIGAKDGPRAIRAALAGLAWQQEHPVYDAGDVVCTDGDLEAAQERLSRVVHDAIFARQRPLVLGGGHEAAWGSHRGLVRAVQGIDPNLKIGIVNIDAHFDLRADPQANSGTPFAQISGWYREIDRLFRYMCLGVSEAANTAALFDRALRFETVWRPDTELDPWQLDEPLTAVRDFVKTVDVIHLSIDLDVLPAAVMPAVSAPAARGVPLASVEAIIATVLKTGKVAVTDLVELNPTFDIDGHGARTAAHLAWLIAKGWPVMVAEPAEPQE